MAFSEALDQFQKNYSAGIERRYLRQRGSYYEALQKEHEHDSMSPEEQQDYVNATDPILAEMDPSGMIGTGSEPAHPHYGLAQLAREQLRTTTSRKEAHQTLGDLFRIQKDYRTEKKVQKQEQLDNDLRNMIQPRVDGIKEVVDSDFPGAGRKELILGQFTQLQQTLSQMAGGRVPFNPELTKIIAGWPKEDQMLLISGLEEGLKSDPHGTAQQFVKVMTATNPRDGLHELFQLYTQQQAKGALSEQIPAARNDDHPATQLDPEIQESENRLAMAKRAAVIDPTKNIAAYNKEREHNFALHQRRNFYEEVYPRGEETVEQLVPNPEKPGLLRRVDYLDRKRQYLQNKMNKITSLGAGYGAVAKEEHTRLEQQLKETMADLKETSGYEKLDDYERRAMEHLRPGIDITNPVQVAAFRSSPQDMKNLRALASAYKADEKADEKLGEPTQVDKVLRALGIHEGSPEYRKYKQKELEKLVQPNTLGILNTQTDEADQAYYEKHKDDIDRAAEIFIDDPVKALTGTGRDPLMQRAIRKRANQLMDERGLTGTDVVQHRQEVAGRAQFAKDWVNPAPTKPGGQRISLNTTLSHAGTLMQAFNHLGNGNTKAANAIFAFLHNQIGYENVVDFNTAKTAFATEIARLFKMGVLSEKDIAEWDKALEIANSPRQMHGALKTATKLMKGRMDALEYAYENTMGKKPNDLLSPDARKTLDMLREPVDRSGKPRTQSKATDDEKQMVLDMIKGLK